MKEIMQSATDIQIAADIATVVTAVATVVATIGGLLLLLATVRQLRLNERQLGLSALVEEANFWLQLREMFAAHTKVHHRLIPGDDWWDPGKLILRKKDDEEEEGDRSAVTWAKDKIVSVQGEYVVPWTGDEQSKTVNDSVAAFDSLPGPRTHEDWRAVEDYMGLFEHCEALLERNLINLQTFEEIYRYRLINIMSNRRIVIAKLGCNRKGWQGFIRLLNMVGIEAPPKENLTIKELCDREVKGSTAMFGE